MPHPAQERAKILVAGDNPRNADLIKAYLTVAGHEVITAPDPQKAFLMVKKAPPDLVIIEAMITKGDGYRLCSLLKGDEATRLIPVIIIAPQPNLEDRLKALEAGCDHLLGWPMRQAELLAQVKALIRRKHQDEQLISVEKTLIALARAVEAKDPYTQGHLERVVHYATLLAQEVGLPPRNWELLRKACLLHDVGKIGVKEGILLKPGPLTQEEFQEMKDHSTIGERICQPLSHAQIIADVVRHHHERYDGLGYPDGLAGEEIPLVARIMALVDAYDSLASDRPYRRRCSPQEAARVLREQSGRQFDPTLVLAFIDLLERGALP